MTSNIKKTRTFHSQQDRFTISEPRPGIIKFHGWSNFYFLKDYGILIDSGRYSDFSRQEIKSVVTDKLKLIIHTHLHYDHCGNSMLFQVPLLASKPEIDSYSENPYRTVLNHETISMLRTAKSRFLAIQEDMTKSAFADKKGVPLFKDIRIILTPGHTLGSICILVKSLSCIFTGDTYFRKNVYGRTDLPTSSPELMHKSTLIIESTGASVILPGHDY